MMKSNYDVNVLLDKLDCDKLPIDPFKIAKNLGITVDSVELPSGIAGMLFTKGKKTYIKVNANESNNRQRFTVAHELGHFLLNHRIMSVDSNDNLDDDLTKSNSSSILFRNANSSKGCCLLEIEANQFAANLLMPKNIFKYQWDLMKSESDFEKLAGTFQVSVLAIENRAKSLKLKK